jgi:hypothetical protein
MLKLLRFKFQISSLAQKGFGVGNQAGILLKEVKLYLIKLNN